MADDYDLLRMIIHLLPPPRFHDLLLYREYVLLRLRDIIPLDEDLAGQRR